MVIAFRKYMTNWLTGVGARDGYTKREGLNTPTKTKRIDKASGCRQFTAIAWMGFSLHTSDITIQTDDQVQPVCSKQQGILTFLPNIWLGGIESSCLECFVYLYLSLTWHSVDTTKPLWNREAKTGRSLIQTFKRLKHRRQIYFWSISLHTELYNYNWHIAASTTLNWRAKTSQELRMLPSVTLTCQVTKSVMNCQNCKATSLWDYHVKNCQNCQ